MPDKTTRSFALSPLHAKLSVRFEMFIPEGGGNWLVSVASDTLPSLLPVGTGQEGPLVCIQRERERERCHPSITASCFSC